MKFLSKLKPYLPILALIVIELILFYLNYVPKTYFLGWDNLFPEMNFKENLQRSFFSVWEQYRGLGFLDGMSFAANLPHYIFLYITSLFLPEDLLRYFFNFFMHFLGGAGIYYLLRQLLSANSNKTILSFLGALFYLFNLGTIQMFYAPYELFSIHFAFLPWLILFSIKYLENSLRKDLIFLAFLSFLSASQAHVPTIFIVYLFALFTIIVFHLLKGRKKGFKKAIIIVFLTFTMNAFWVIPYAYYGLTNSKTTIDSKINQMSTESIYLINKARGDLLNVVLLRGFWLDYTDSQNKGTNDYIMPVWREHTQKIFFSLIGIFLFLLSLAGSVIALKKRNREFYPFIVMFLSSFLMLGNDIPILKSVFDFFYKYIPYFAQLFRFTFTKFSILYVFSFSILLALALSEILEQAKRLKYIKTIIPIGFAIILLYYSLPAFHGQFIYKNLRVKIPSDYFELVNYFEQQGKNERIALLPQPSYWGWTYTNWGYRGSGFIWYGLPQPSLDGSSFPWSRENENYYWELDQAINSSKKTYFEAVLNKYQISWIILDHSVISLYSSKASSSEGLEKLIESSKKIKLAAKFGSINVYRVEQGLEQENFVSLVFDLPKIAPKYQWGNFDIAYLENANYMNSDPKNSKIFYPFRSIFTGREQKELEFEIFDKGNYFSFQTKIPTSLAGSTLFIPKIFEEEISEINENDFTEKILMYSQIFIDNELVLTPIETSNDPEELNFGTTKIFLPYIREGKFELRIPKLEGYYSYKSKIKGDLFNRSYKKCNPFAKGNVKNEEIIEDGENLLHLTSLNSSNCFNFDLPYFSQRIGYLVKIKSSNIEGKSLLFSIINNNSQKPNFESNLPKKKALSDSYFVIPPMDNYGLGYNLYFDNASMGNVKTVNALADLEVHQIPYRFLISLKIAKYPESDGKQSSKGLGVNDFEASHPNPSLYTVSRLNLSEGQTLVLSQSYDKGWQAYSVNVKCQMSNVKCFLAEVFPFIFGKPVGEHVLVNNWANGWNFQQSTISNQPSTIIIVYLPQYLEYIGIILSLSTVFVLIIIYRGKNRKSKLNKMS